MVDLDPGKGQQPKQPNKKPINQNNNMMAMSMTEASSKIHELKSYDKAINVSIHGRQWREANKKKFQNLENH